MVFKCQEDSFLKEYTSNVISCIPAELNIGNSKIDGYNVILDETILFPEGGGQPCDHGTLNGKSVRNVVRKGADAVHFVESEVGFDIGDKVNATLEWSRRFDHMQQHSGQHLLTALFDREYGFDTTSWWLGLDSSYIELGTKDVTATQVEHVEKLANELIVEGRKVFVTVTSREEGIKFQDARAPRGLPGDHVGPVRVVSIEGIESNMCCGTHVTNLSQLQCAKVLNIEKAKGKVYIHFLIGNRVTKKLQQCFSRELEMNTILKGGPASHVDLIKKLQTNLKTTQRSFQKLLKDVATYESEKLKTPSFSKKYYSLHRQDGIEPDFISTFLRNAPPDVFYFLTVSDNSGKGHMQLRGDSELVAKFGKAFAELLDGKGNAKGVNFQAKVNNLSKLKECEKMLVEHFSN